MLGFSPLIYALVIKAGMDREHYHQHKWIYWQKFEHYICLSYTMYDERKKYDMYILSLIVIKKWGYFSIVEMQLNQCKWC